MPNVAPTTSLDLNDFLCFALHSTAQAVGRANKPMLDKIGLTYAQYLAMVVLWAEDNQTVSSIGEKLLLESNTLTPLLKRLEVAGYLRRSRDTADERQVRITLTDQGRALHDKARTFQADWTDLVFGDDKEAVRDLKRRVLDVRNKLTSAAQG